MHFDFSVIIKYFISSGVTYEISVSISSHENARTLEAVYVQISGTAGTTEELMCPSDTFAVDPGTTVTCTVTSAADIGDYTCVTWRKDGLDGLKIAEFTISVDGVIEGTVTPADGWLDDNEGSNGLTATWCEGTVLLQNVNVLRNTDN